MTKTDNIVSTMITQHRALQADLGKVAGVLEREEGPNTKAIVELLKVFTKDLLEHLKLENDVFYVELLKKMKAKDQDTAKTEQFIVEMKDIEKIVLVFLENYKDPRNIKKGIDEFKSQFEEIVETLDLRIESEEAGVYSYWGLF